MLPVISIYLETNSQGASTYVIDWISGEQDRGKQEARYSKEEEAQIRMSHPCYLLSLRFQSRMLFHYDDVICLSLYMPSFSARLPEIFE